MGGSDPIPEQSWSVEAGTGYMFKPLGVWYLANPGMPSSQGPAQRLERITDVSGILADGSHHGREQNYHIRLP